MYEKLICDKLTPLLIRYVNEAKHGFGKGKSTETNLVIFMNYALTNMEKYGKVDVIHTEFSKAFDIVNIEILMNMLRKLKMPVVFSEWLHCYLTGRTQMVRRNGCTSKRINMLFGVPQGSHLGTLLFLLFVTDLCDVLESCKHFFYFDDLKIFKAICNIILFEKNFFSRSYGFLPRSTCI